MIIAYHYSSPKTYLVGSLANIVPSIIDKNEIDNMTYGRFMKEHGMVKSIWGLYETGEFWLIDSGLQLMIEYHKKGHHHEIKYQRVLD